MTRIWSEWAQHISLRSNKRRGVEQLGSSLGS